MGIKTKWKEKKYIYIYTYTFTCHYIPTIAELTYILNIKKVPETKDDIPLCLAQELFQSRQIFIRAFKFLSCNIEKSLTTAIIMQFWNVRIHFRYMCPLDKDMNYEHSQK